ncbi:D-alanyl-D-alanine carboxypeptidase, partial [Brevibacterium sp. UMB10442]|nr:D-alanyl-D-alanine carboxypeptidase [Brevibacterium sp. UMB10442]
GNDKKAKKKEAKKVEIAIDTAMQSRLKAFGNARRPKGNFGFYVYDLTADKPIYGVNERVAQSSASCMKLLTAVAGMRLLGTRY